MMKMKEKILTVMLVSALVLAPSMSVGASGAVYLGSGSTYTETGESGSVLDKVITDSEEGAAENQAPVEETNNNDTQQATPVPTEAPTEQPTEQPTQEPTQEPTVTPTETPTEGPTVAPEAESTPESTQAPLEAPSEAPAESAEENDSLNNGDGTENQVNQIPETELIEDQETSITGIYLGTAVDGCIVVTSEEEIRNGYGLSEDEIPYAKFFNLNTKENPVTAKVLEMAAASQGAEAGPMLNVELGKMIDGDNYSRLAQDGSEIEMMFGIPEYFADAGKTYAVVCVRRDGSAYINRDLDNNAETVTFKTTGGAGAYAIIRY